jgi:DnaJ like chaperone protein
MIPLGKDARERFARCGVLAQGALAPPRFLPNGGEPIKTARMTIWGKLAGAAAGFMLGGPIGALLGALAGHFIVDEGLLAPEQGPPLQSVVFTVGLIALAAKMAKADGVVTRDEVAAFRRLVAVAPEDEAHVSRLFDLAKQSTAGFDAYARQLAQLLKDTPDTLEDLVDGLFGIATADGAVHVDERAYLAEVAAIFGLPEQAFSRIEARHVVSGPRDPYRVLGIARRPPTARSSRPGAPSCTSTTRTGSSGGVYPPSSSPLRRGRWPPSTRPMTCCAARGGSHELRLRPRP